MAKSIVGHRDYRAGEKLDVLTPPRRLNPGAPTFFMK